MERRAYKFVTYQPIYHNGEFSHNVVRDFIIAVASDGGPPAVRHLLHPAGEPVIVGDLTITAEAEYVKYMYAGRMVAREEFVPDA